MPVCLVAMIFFFCRFEIQCGQTKRKRPAWQPSHNGTSASPNLLSPLAHVLGTPQYTKELLYARGFNCQNEHVSSGSLTARINTLKNTIDFM